MKTFLTLIAILLSFGLFTDANACEKCKGGKCGDADPLLELSVEKEVLYRRTMRDAKNQADAIMKEIEELKEDKIDVLTSSSFDEQKFRRISSEIKELKDKKYSIFKEAIIGLARQFDRDDREIMAEAIKRHCKKGGGGCGKCPKK